MQKLKSTLLAGLFKIILYVDLEISPSLRGLFAKKIDFLFFVSVHFKWISFIKIKCINFFYVVHSSKDFYYTICSIAGIILESVDQAGTLSLRGPAQFTHRGAPAPSFRMGWDGTGYQKCPSISLNYVGI